MLEYTRPGPFERQMWLGLEAEPYGYVAAQVHVLSYYTPSSSVWEMSQRPRLGMDGPFGFVSPEFFLPRLDEPDLLFRYGWEYCTQPDGTKPEYPALGGPRDPVESIRLPGDLPSVVEHRQGDYLSLQDATGKQPMADGGRLVWAALGTPDDFKNDLGFSHFADLLRDPNQGPNTVYWVVLRVLGDGGGPHRAGHELGSYAAIDASGNGEGGSSMCCVDLIFAP